MVAGVRWAPKLVSIVRCLSRSSSMMHVIQAYHTSYFWRTCPSFQQKIVCPPRTLKNTQMFSFLGIMNNENKSNHCYTKYFGKFLFKLRPADVVTFFLLFTIDFGRKTVHLRT